MCQRKQGFMVLRVAARGFFGLRDAVVEGLGCRDLALNPKS